MVTQQTPPRPRGADVADSYNRGVDAYEALWSPARGSRVHKCHRRPDARAISPRTTQQVWLKTAAAAASAALPSIKLTCCRPLPPGAGGRGTEWQEREYTIRRRLHRPPGRAGEGSA